MGFALVITCAKGKRLPTPPSRQLRRVGAGPAAERVTAWVRRLDSGPGGAVPASCLYRGDHWQAAVDAAGTVERAGGQSWVCSAGYGLVPFDAPLRSYSATFTPTDPDSVLRLPGSPGTPAGSAWWDALATWAGPAPGCPRRIADVAAASPPDRLVAAVSEPYLRALTPDLLAARARLRTPNRLIIICVGAPKSHPLAENLVPCDGRVQAAVGGALAAVNARVVRRLLDEIEPATWSLPVVRDRVAAWLGEAVQPERPARRRVSDAEVLVFVRRRLDTEPTASASALHREFRASGWACERVRFAALFHAVTKERVCPTPAR
jgi:hypothetical protein